MAQASSVVMPKAKSLARKITADRNVTFSANLVRAVVFEKNGSNRVYITSAAKAQESKFSLSRFFQKKRDYILIYDRLKGLQITMRNQIKMFASRWPVDKAKFTIMFSKNVVSWMMIKNS